MSVGAQTGKGTWDQTFTDLAVAWRDLAQRTQSQVMQATAVGSALAYMEAQGYDNNASNPNNPGQETDAAYAAALIGYFTTLSGIVLGTQTQSSDFPFVNAMAPVMAGR